MREIFDEKTAGSLLRINKVVTSGEFMRGGDNERLIEHAVRSCQYEIAQEITKKYFTFERVMIADCVAVQGACYVLTPDEYRDALLRAYKKGQDSVMGAGRFQV